MAHIVDVMMPTIYVMVGLVFGLILGYAYAKEEQPVIQDQKSAYEKAIEDWLSAPAGKYPPCLLLDVDMPNNTVTLLLDTNEDCYGSYIKGERGDVCLYRRRSDDLVAGVMLPLYQKQLMVFYDGPVLLHNGNSHTNE